MYSRQSCALKNVMWWLILLLLLNVGVNSQKQDEESLPTKEPQSSSVQKETSPPQSVPPQKELQHTGLQQAPQQQDPDSVLQESRRPPEEQPEVQPSTQRQEIQQQQKTEEVAESQPRQQEKEHQGKQESRLQGELQHEQGQSDGEEDGVQMKQEADPTSESLPTSSPSREERQQSHDEGTKLQQREMMSQEDNDQPPSSSDPLRDRLLPQDNQEEHEELRVEDEDDESLQEQQQSVTTTATAQEVEDAKEGEYHDHSIDEDLGDEDDGALPSDLPSLRWGQTAEIIKCCPPGEALARPEDGSGELECRPAPDDQSWHPLLLNGRSGLRVPPDSRSALVSGNVSCEAGNHFWLDSSAGDQFELLTTGHLYLRRADALLAPLSFCTDRLLVPPDQQQGDKEEEGGGARAAHVCTLSLQERRSLLDENTLMPACARRTCLRKCCPRGLKVRWSDQLCVPQTGARPWQPSFWQHEDPTSAPTATPPAPEESLTMSGNPPCRGPDGKLGKVFALQPAYYDEDAFFLREDGRLWVPHQHVTVPLEDFCVDQVEYDHPQQPGVLIDYHAAIVCFGSGSEGGGSELRVSVGTHVYRALLLVSALFLLVTLLVYCAVPELRNLHGRCLLSHVAALLTAYTCNLAGQMPTVYSSMAACQTTALLMYFSFLAACFWLNAMSFDIWLTFSRLRSAAPNRSQTGRFIKYSVYCWCCPLVLTALVITMQFVPDRLVPPENFIRPRLGEMSCWFPGSWEMLVYFHAPILMLMAANLVFFLLTAKNLIQTEKDTRMAGRQKKGTERFKIYVNLFIVMGITWIAEALSIHMGPKEIWIVTDVFNALQGFFIFLLFTLRRNTRNTIRRHFAASRLGRCCCKVTRLVPGLSSRKTSSTATAGSSSSKLSAQGQQNGTQPLKPVAEEEDDKADTPV